MAPRALSDVDIMERFLTSTEDLGETRTAVARIEAAVNDLVAAQVRCQDHANRIREVEMSNGKLWQTLKTAGWIVGTSIGVIGVIASIAAFF